MNARHETIKRERITCKKITIDKIPKVNWIQHALEVDPNLLQQKTFLLPDHQFPKLQSLLS